MTKRISAKHKVERRYGVVLWDNGKSPVHKRNYPPGQHGPKGPRRKTHYGQQVAAKQILKAHYANVSERQLRTLFKEAMRRPGDTGANLVDLLERRLDSTVRRLKFAPSPQAARQMVVHKHILVNGKTVDRPSFRLKDQDVITLVESMRQNVKVVSSMASGGETPKYIEHRPSEFSGKFLHRPDIDMVPYPFHLQINSIVELYSR